jgi:hypothetical protein
MDFKPENEFISLSTLETYIEKYPEDAEKWLEFIEMQDESDKPRIYRRGEIDEEIKETQKNILEKNLDSPIDNFNDGCLYCKKSWVSTEGVPKITMICGHSYHTVCYMHEQYSTDSLACIVEGCTIDTWSYVRNIYKSNEDRKRRVENILLTSYKNRSDFKEHISEFKKNISEFQKSSSNLEKLVRVGRLNLIHKHIHAIRHFETDMNQAVNDIKLSEEYAKYKNNIKKHRKQAAAIFRKYHVSYRDLHLNNLVSGSWRIRYILERHGKFNFYKMGLRLYPGKKPYRDVLDLQVDEDEHDDLDQNDDQDQNDEQEDD